ncbi:MAG: DMT family transporter [Proteobacteria bacterium]|jgi:drug/metabolite transporter (DMT)-like permease|nr:DMT family transporter [Pseudomonadota bacterium]MDA1238983.1 DMT family transporter [Pseudomonadota bacterium]
MNFGVISVILLAAFLHAFWNFLVRGNSDKTVGMAAIVYGHLPLALLGLAWFGFPKIEALGYIIASSVLHVGYQAFLMNSYRFGGLTQVYPIARGSAPLMIVIISVIISTDHLKYLEILGILTVSLGILLHGFSQFNKDSFGPTGLILAIFTGAFIASYSLVDGTGTRVALNAISYYGALTIGNCILFSIYLCIFNQGVFRRLLADGKYTFVVGGSASYLAYVLVLWACLTLPIAVVSSIRETSVLFALGLGVLFLGEEITFKKVIHATVILLGIVVLHLA